MEVLQEKSEVLVEWRAVTDPLTGPAGAFPDASFLAPRQSSHLTVTQGEGWNADGNAAPGTGCPPSHPAHSYLRATADTALLHESDGRPDRGEAVTFSKSDRSDSTRECGLVRRLGAPLDFPRHSFFFFFFSFSERMWHCPPAEAYSTWTDK